MSINRMHVANEVIHILRRGGVPEPALSHIWDRLLDGLSDDTDQELTTLYAMLRPDDSSLIFLKDGKMSSPKEPGAVAYRRV